MPDAKELRSRHRDIRHRQPEALAIRLHRAISWLGRAEQAGSDDDTRFIHLWIAFNAAYAGALDAQDSERIRVSRFLDRITAEDTRRDLHALLFQQFSGPIRTLIENRFTFAPFWQAMREHDASAHWNTRFDASRKTAMTALLDGRTATVLGIVLDRLYVLRNQLVHGGATWNSQVNRAQLHDACAILGALVPTMLAIMLESDAFSDDPIAYPVVPG